MPNRIGTKAEELNNQAVAVENQVRDLRTSMTGVTDAAYRKQMEEQMARLANKPMCCDRLSRDAQAAGDRLYWPIYNLDLKNPNYPDAR